MSGVLAAAVALGVAQLVAGITGDRGSPVVAVGRTAIDFTPPAAKNFAISTFGANDKLVLVSGILVVVTVFAAIVGVLAGHRLWYGLVGLALFAAIGVAAAASRPDTTPVDVLPTFVGVAAGAVTLLALIRTLSPGPRTDFAAPRPGAVDRRRFLTVSAAAIGVAAVGGVGGEALSGRHSVANARAGLRLPRPARPGRPVPVGADLHISGLAPFVTSNGDFYRVDTALLLPQVQPESWRLRIHGTVRREVEVSLADLLARPLIEDDITLCCVSNPVAGPYIGNARWLGASLASLLREAGIQRGADQLLCRSVDGFTSGTPVEVVMDGRDALLAVGMNGQPLPVAHGFPVRMVVPGLYGYVSATKWVTDIDVTTYAARTAYWASRGWSDQAPIKTESRIDVPHDGARISVGPAQVAGVAWAQHKGVDAVEVRVDGGPWQLARLAAVPGIDTWRQWVWTWNPPPGRHRIEARATDATGYAQTANEAPPEPNGATGYPAISVKVT